MSRVATRVAACRVLASFVLTSGCSVLSVRPPRRDRGRIEPTGCTTVRAAPVIDVMLATAELMRTIYALSLNDYQYRNMILSRDADIGVGVVSTALFSLSAGYGFAATDRCRQLLLRYPTNPSVRAPANRPGPVQSPQQDDDQNEDEEVPRR